MASFLSPWSDWTGSGLVVGEGTFSDSCLHALVDVTGLTTVT